MATVETSSAVNVGDIKTRKKARDHCRVSAAFAASMAIFWRHKPCLATIEFQLHIHGRFLGGSISWQL